MLQLHWRNTSIGIQIKGNPAGMSAMVHPSLMEKYIHIMNTCWPWQMQCSEWNDVLNAVYAKPLIIIYWTASKTGLFDRSLAQTACGAAIFFPCNSVSGTCTELWTNLTFCAIPWTYVGTFTGNGVNSLHRLHEWALENPFATWHSSFPQRLSIDIWIKVWLPNWIAYLSGIKDTGFLERTLPLLSDDVSLSIHKGMWFQHNSTPLTLHIKCTAGWVANFADSCICCGIYLPSAFFWFQSTWFFLIGTCHRKGLHCGSINIW